MKYTITKISEPTKTSTGKDMYKATFLNPEGIEETINIFDKLDEGQDIEGEIYTNDKGYRNFKSAQAQKKAENGVAFKTAQTEKLMERKESSISKFQDSKEYSIKVSSTMRDSVLLAIAQGSPTVATISKWREWLWNNWEPESDQYPPFVTNAEKLKMNSVLGDDYPSPEEAGIK